MLFKKNSHLSKLRCFENLFSRDPLPTEKEKKLLTKKQERIIRIFSSPVLNNACLCPKTFTVETTE